VATLGVATLWAADSLGLSALAAGPLPAAVEGMPAMSPWDTVPASSDRALRRAAVQFVLKHPGVKVINGPDPSHRGPHPHSRIGLGRRASFDSGLPEGGTAGPLLPLRGLAFVGADYEALGVSGASEDELIPRLVHQTWKDTNVPARWARSHAAWAASYGQPEPFTVLLWSDAALSDFITGFFPWFAATYAGYGVPIQRVDAARYFILYALGGIYADLDVGFRESPQWARLLRAEAAMPVTAPLGLSNDLMAAAPGHPYFALLCRRLTSPLASAAWLYTRFFTVMFSTGPSFVSTQLVSYRLQRRARGLGELAFPDAAGVRSGEPGIWLLEPWMYDSGRRSIVGHVAGASWHDASTSFLWALFEVLPEHLALPGTIVIIFVTIASAVVGVVLAIGWGAACGRQRPARALVCCLFRSLRLADCCGPPSRPRLCPCTPEPLLNPPDNPRRGGAAGAGRPVQVLV